MNEDTSRRLMGIDYGEKRVGIAVSDEGGMIAIPKQVLQNDSKLMERITQIVNQESISEIVLGESMNQNGEDNVVMEEIRAFKTSLEDEVNAPIHFEPEYMTSQQARRSGNKLVDAKAAALILQSFIDKRKHE